MLRILLVCAGLIAIATVLWSSWRVDRRLFAFVLVVVVIGAALFGVGYWHSAEQGMVPVEPAEIEVSVSQARATETGIRLSGRVFNRSSLPLALLQGRAVLEECTPECNEIGEASFIVRQHVPIGGSYPYSQIVRLPASLLADPQADAKQQRRWRIEVLSASGYASAGRTGS